MRARAAVVAVRSSAQPGDQREVEGEQRFGRNVGSGGKPREEREYLND